MSVFCLHIQVVAYIALDKRIVYVLVKEIIFPEPVGFIMVLPQAVRAFTPKPGMDDIFAPGVVAGDNAGGLQGKNGCGQIRDCIR